MKDNITKNAIKYSNLNGIPGHENDIAVSIREELSQIGNFRYERDGLGSMAVIKKSKKEGAPIVTISAHMDEVGFMVTDFLKDGFLKFTPIGGWWGHVLLGQRLTITTRLGKEITAIVGCKPPHIIGIQARSKVVDIKDMYLDVGAETLKQAKEWGIQLGDMITPYQDTAYVTTNVNRIVGKAHDDRISIVAGIEIMRNLAEEKLDVTVILIGTTQEEVGLRGAKTSSYKWTGDLAFAIDVTLDYSAPEMPDKEPKLGKGLALSLFDRSVIANNELFNSVKAFAVKNKIPHTVDSMPNGGTDSGSIHLTKDGIINMTLSIPCRYFHTHNSIIDIRDVESTSKLLSEYIKQLDADKIEQLRFN